MSDEEDKKFRAGVEEFRKNYNAADWDLEAMFQKAVDEGWEPDPTFAEKVCTFIGKAIGVIICIIIALVFFSWFPIITSIVVILAFIGWVTEKKKT